MDKGMRVSSLHGGDIHVLNPFDIGNQDPL